MRVFISHSVKGDPPAELIARTVYAALQARNLQPFLDLEGLEAGSRWEETLRREIDRADAAVLLLSKKALKSEWVGREVNLLQIRGGARPGFLLLPVFLGDTRSADLKTGSVAILDLDHLQALQVDGNDAWLEQAIAALERARGGTLESYLSALHALAEELPSASLSTTRVVPQLSEIYVPRQVEEPANADARGREGPTTTNRRAEEEKQQGQRHRSLDFDELLKRPDHFVVEGGPGTGKSTLLAYVASSTGLNWVGGTQSHGAPVLVKARTLAQRKGSFSASLREEVRESLGRKLVHTLPEDFFEQPPAPKTRWLVLVDALDEVADARERDRLVSDISHVARRSDSPYRFVLTTRPLGTARSLSQSGFALVQMLPFLASQVEAFARKWFAGRDGGAEAFLQQLTASRITDLVTRPLLLTIAAIVFEDSTRVVESRAALYRAFVATVLDGEVAVARMREQVREPWQALLGTKGIETADTLVENRHLIVRHLAGWVRRGAVGPLALEAIRFSHARGWISTAEEPGHVARMEFFLGRTGLIGGAGAGQSFVHPTFADYLVAAELDEVDAEHVDALGAHLGQWRDPRERQLALFLLGLLSARGVAVERWLRGIARKDDGVRFCGLAIAEGIRVSGDFEDRIIAGLLQQAAKLKFWEAGPKHALEVLGMLRRRDKVRVGLLALARGASMSEWSRAQTADALAQLGLVEDLRSLSSDQRIHSSVRLRAAQRLGEHDAEAAREVLVALARDAADGYQRRDAIEAVWSLGFALVAQSLAVGLLLDETTSTNEYLRARVLITLGGIGCPQAARDLLLREAFNRGGWGSDDDVLKGIVELGGVAEIRRLRPLTRYPVQLGSSLVNALFRQESDEEASALLAEMIASPAAKSGERDPFETAFGYSADPVSLSRVVKSATTNAAVKQAAVGLLKSMGFDEQGNSTFASRRSVIRLIGRRLHYLTWSATRWIPGAAQWTLWRVRGAAGGLLRLAGRKRYIQHLVATARNTKAPPEVRTGATDVLLDVAEIDLARDCMRLLIADPRVHYRSAYVFNLLSVDEDAEPWRVLADGRDTYDVRYFFELLRTKGDPEIAQRLIIRAVSDEQINPEFTAVAIDALGAWPESGLAESLAKNAVLKPWQRILAVQQMPAEPDAALVSIAIDESIDEWTRMEAVDALRRFGLLLPLIALAEGGDVNVKIRRHAVWSIGALGGAGAAQRLRDLAAADQPTDVRAALEHATCLLALRGVSPNAATR